MRAFLVDPELQTVTEIDFDGSQSKLCELLGQPIENVETHHTEYCDDYALYPKNGDAESGPCWIFGDFDSNPSWDIVLKGRLIVSVSARTESRARHP